MVKTVAYLFAFCQLGIGGTVLLAEAPPEKHSFAIYLAEDMDRRFVAHGTGDWRGAELAETPIITEADIVSYDTMLHTMTITPAAMARLPKPPASGRPFVVVADGEPVYPGVFVTCVSSFSFAVPAIWVDRRAVFPDEPANTLVIDRAYPASSAGAGADPRSDKRIVTALTALGKLVSYGPTVDTSLTQKIGEILNDCRWIKPGTTRAELLNTFTTEGGLSTATQRTYVHRRCPYIKLDVEFSLSEAGQSATDEQPTDTIKKVSRPYLNWSIND
jgi:hypothetical protein